MKRPGLFVLMSLLFACWGRNASGQTFTPLWQFGSLSNDADGGSPGVTMIQGRDGNFYGTSGWTNEVNCTVFKITPQGTLTTLWQFGSLSNNADGTSLMSGLVQGRDGDFYGTTARGGTNRFCGTAYKITSAGTLTPLWQFVECRGRCRTKWVDSGQRWQFLRHNSRVGRTEQSWHGVSDHSSGQPDDPLFIW